MFSYRHKRNQRCDVFRRVVLQSMFYTFSFTCIKTFILPSFLPLLMIQMLSSPVTFMFII